MSKSKIISAAIEGFKQKLHMVCQNCDNVFDRIDEKNFSEFSHMLMEAAQEAGKAGLIQYLKENDMICSGIEKEHRKYRYKGTSLNELLTLFGKISFERAMYYDEKRGGEYYFPLDAALGLEKDDFATLETREMILFDFYHATEHLSKAADAIFGEKTDLSKAYFMKWRGRLKTDQTGPISILRSLEGYSKRLRLTEKRKGELKTEIVFFKNNHKLMRYAEFRKRGLPIGSGPIEAAAKSIVRQRMCRSGMSWSREKGQHVLTVRAFVKSGLWDQAWEHYKDLKKAA